MIPIDFNSSPIPTHNNRNAECQKYRNHKTGDRARHLNNSSYNEFHTRHFEQFDLHMRDSLLTKQNYARNTKRFERDFANCHGVFQNWRRFEMY